MSTFTNVLQQKINNLEAQIRQLQEQNAHLRNKAKLIKEYSDYSPSIVNPLELSSAPEDPEIPGTGYWDDGTGLGNGIFAHHGTPALERGNRMTDYYGNIIYAPIWSNNGYWYVYESDPYGNLVRVWRLKPGGQWQIM